ncbi:MAG TPA: dephospho-CoA kinase, partial [Methylophilaceae bacterium]|nr:dephospho-CoA kinase [Methylophilaceae bacterium]
GIGSGKSEAAQIFASLGVPVVDVDAISHQLTSAGSPVLKEIINVFGKSYLLADGSLDRAALREKVFADEAARRQLEEILHPAIHEQALQALSKNTGAPYQILVIPLLFEGSRYQDIINRTLVIDCDESLQIARAIKRSGLSEQAVITIMGVQVSRKMRLALADDVIENNGSLQELSKKIEQIHKKYMQTCIVSE